MKHLVLISHKCCPLIHELQPQLLSFLHIHGEVEVLRDHILQLEWKFSQRFFLAELFRPPVATLWGHIGRRDDSDVGIDKEERDNLAMTWLGRVGQFERKDAVLKDVRESEETALLAEYAPDLLYGRPMLVTAIDGLEPFMVVLLVRNIACILFGALLAE